MKLILHGWLGHDKEHNLGISLKRAEESYSWQYSSLAEEIMRCFNYIKVDEGLGRKITTIENANLRCWFSDDVCTLEEAQMNFESYMVTGNLLTQGHYVGYSEWTITGFNVDDLIIGGHNLETELKEHVGQYMHFILTDDRITRLNGARNLLSIE